MRQPMAPRAKKTLTAFYIKHKMTDEGFFRDADTPGLAVQVSWRERNGERAPEHGITKSFVFIYTSPVTGKVRTMGLGSCDAVSLDDRVVSLDAKKKKTTKKVKGDDDKGITLVGARTLAKTMRALVKQGLDPIEVRAAKKIEDAAERQRVKASTMTFRECVEGLLASKLKEFRNDKHRQQWRSTLERANKDFGDLPVSEIDEAKILKLLRPMWQTTGETASRLRGRIEKVLAWATPEYRQGENPARWKNHLDVKLGKRADVVHYSAMPYEEVPAFMVKLRDHEGIGPRALEFLILTAVRSGDIYGATWKQFDLPKKLWHIPRTKAGNAHTVPLCRRALAILKSLPHVGDHVFPGNIAGKSISDATMRKVLRSSDGNGYDVHAFRSTFTDWCGDETLAEEETAEHALAHQVGSKVRRAYRRRTALNKRTALMQQWCDYCASGIATGDNVVPLKSA